MDERDEGLVWPERGDGGRCRWFVGTEIWLRVFVLCRRLEEVGISARLGSVGSIQRRLGVVWRLVCSGRGVEIGVVGDVVGLLRRWSPRLLGLQGVTASWASWFVVVGGWKSGW